MSPTLSGLLRTRVSWSSSTHAALPSGNTCPCCWTLDASSESQILYALKASLALKAYDYVSNKKKYSVSVHGKRKRQREAKASNKSESVK
jgi:hypothetical protein